MNDDAYFEIPLDALANGDHEFSYVLDDAFFGAYEDGLVKSGQFAAKLLVSRVRNQFTLNVQAAGIAQVECDRCLEVFALPLEVTDEVIVKFDNGTPREEENVVFVPYGTERFDVAKVFFDAIGLSLPMQVTHDLAELPCDPSTFKYIADPGAAKPDQDADTTQSSEISDDSPWSALRDLGSLSEN